MMLTRLCPFVASAALACLLTQCSSMERASVVRRESGGESAGNVFSSAAPVVGRYGSYIVVVRGGGRSSSSRLVDQMQRRTEALHSPLASFRSLPGYPRIYAMWMDEETLRADGEARVRINLAAQRGTLLINERVAMDFPICSGKNHSTPRGLFRITQKDAKHWSNLYDCPMPYFMRLTNSGVGLHVGDVLPVPASHGCIRLPKPACEPLFHRVSLGVPVEVF